MGMGVQISLRPLFLIPSNKGELLGKRFYELTRRSHLLGPHLSEEVVIGHAATLSDLLWRDRWRRVEV